MRAVSRFLVMIMLMAVVFVGVTAVSAQTDTYVVGPNDDLVSIAQRFGITVDCLTSQNYIAGGNILYVGQRLNIAGCQTTPGTVSTPAPPAPAVTTPSTYTVRPGDSLTDIASAYGLDLTCLVQANGLANANLIRSGQVLALTTCSGQTSATSPTSPTTVIASTYTVRSGDSLMDVAQHFGVDLTCLVRVNALADMNRIVVGQVLQIDPCIAQDGGIAPLPVSQSYTIQRGDRLNNIAAVFGVDADCLARTNYLANPNYLRPGETLTIDFEQCATQAS